MHKPRIASVVDNSKMSGRAEVLRPSTSFVLRIFSMIDDADVAMANTRRIFER